MKPNCRIVGLVAIVVLGFFNEQILRALDGWRSPRRDASAGEVAVRFDLQGTLEGQGVSVAAARARGDTS